MTETTPAERAEAEARTERENDALRRAALAMTPAEQAERDALFLRNVAAEETARRVEHERVMEKERAERAAAESAAEQDRAAADARAVQVRAALAAEAETFRRARLSRQRSAVAQRRGRPSSTDQKNVTKGPSA
jgi:hypothetical protein